MKKIQFSYRVEKKLLDDLKVGAIYSNLSVSEYITNMVLLGIANKAKGVSTSDNKNLYGRCQDEYKREGK